MSIQELMESKLSIGIVSGIGGIAVSIATQWFLNKRAVFRYDVVHNPVGLSTDDDIYGSVRVTWNDTTLDRLFLSTVRIENESLKDFESVVISVFSSDTRLLTEFTAMEGTTRILEYTDDYIQKIRVAPGEDPTDEQFELFRRQRDYIVPTMNRGQVLKFEFLNAPTTEAPSIWVDIVHKGVVCRFKKPVNLIYGVSQPRAAVVGTIICLTAVGILVSSVKHVPAVAVGSFALGWITVIPGAAAIMLTRKIRELFAG